MKLTNKQIEEIRKLREKKVKLVEIAIRFNITPPTVLYYTDEAYRQRTINKTIERFRSKTKEERSKIYKQRLPYMKKYYRERYNSDEEFRDKQLKRVAEYQKKKSKTKSTDIKNVQIG